MPVRLRQAVLAARDLESVTTPLTAALGLGDPFHDEDVGLFGLRNAVYALGDTFLEVVSPVAEHTAAGRLLDRRGTDACGYMLMFQLDEPDAKAVRERAAANDVRVVFDVTLEDIDEVHLHPADMQGAIVAASVATPPGSWRWGGPDWTRRAAPGAIAGATIAVPDPDAVAHRWGAVLGALPAGVAFERDPASSGPVEIALDGAVLAEAVEIGGVRFVPLR